jgi:hypothetical protein
MLASYGNSTCDASYLVRSGHALLLATLSRDVWLFDAVIAAAGWAQPCIAGEEEAGSRQQGTCCLETGRKSCVRNCMLPGTPLIFLTMRKP